LAKIAPGRQITASRLFWAEIACGFMMRILGAHIFGDKEQFHILATFFI
jgi:hypothetical protein